MSECGPSTCELEKVLKGVAISVQTQLENIFHPTSRRAILIAGPTGVGKTELSLQLAEKLNGEIVSCDSVQVYREMDIGTAKVSKEERKRIPHHLIDIREINDPFNVVDFYEAAKASCLDIFIRGKVPIVVGGTGFYFHALLYGPPRGPPANAEIRKKLQEDLDKFGLELLYEKLEAFDPKYAQTITKGDAHKIVRALEIIEFTGKPVSAFDWNQRTLESYFNFRAHFVYKERTILYPHTDARCDEMLKKGLLDEVVALDRKGIRNNSTCCQAIGYKQSLDFLDTAQTPNDYQRFVETFKTATRHLAKRQFTWFRKEPLFEWLDIGKIPLKDAIERIASDYEKG